jgi:hypothetical protein
VRRKLAAEAPMKETLSRVMEGDASVLEWYATARKRWDESMAGVDLKDPEAIAKIARRDQLWFEKNCGPGESEREVGQEIMVVSGILRYCDAGSEFHKTIHEARAMYNGLRNSACSIEIHSMANELGGLYPELAEENRE